MEKMRVGRSKQSERVSTFLVQAQLVRSGTNHSFVLNLGYISISVSEKFRIFRGNILFEFWTAAASASAFVALSIEDNLCSQNWFHLFTLIQSVNNNLHPSQSVSWLFCEEIFFHEAPNLNGLFKEELQSYVFVMWNPTRKACHLGPTKYFKSHLYADIRSTYSSWQFCILNLGDKSFGSIWDKTSSSAKVALG